MTTVGFVCRFSFLGAEERWHRSRLPYEEQGKNAVPHGQVHNAIWAEMSDWRIWITQIRMQLVTYLTNATCVRKTQSLQIATQSIISEIIPNSVYQMYYSYQNENTINTTSLGYNLDISICLHPLDCWIYFDRIWMFLACCFIYWERRRSEMRRQRIEPVFLFRHLLLTTIN